MRPSSTENNKGFTKTRQIIILIGLSLLSLSSHGIAQSGTCAGTDIGAGADLNGFIPFPADDAWNTDVSSMPVDPNSDNIIAFIGANSQLHPDFGAGLYDGSKIGIPYQVVDITVQPKVISGAPDERWNNSELDQLKKLTALAFEVVLMGPVYTPDNVPTGPSPVLSSFTADPPKKALDDIRTTACKLYAQAEGRRAGKMRMFLSSPAFRNR